MKSLKGTQTEKNILTAFAGESQARNRYTFFASQAKKDGYVEMAKAFEEIASQEKEHAKRLFKFLEGGNVEITASFPAIAAVMRNIAIAEMEHERRFLAFAKAIEDDTVFKSAEPRVWRCQNCGFTHVGTAAPEMCPACAHPRDHFQGM